LTDAEKESAENHRVVEEDGTHNLSNVNTNDPINDPVNGSLIIDLATEEDTETPNPSGVTLR